MIHVLATIEVAAGKRDEVLTQFAWLTPQVRAEDGCLEYGAAVDVEGHYWVAMFEGGRVLKLSPGGQILADIPTPAMCPTMPCGRAVLPKRFGTPCAIFRDLTAVSKDKRSVSASIPGPW